MMPKFGMSTILSVASVIIVGAGSALGQWAAMKQWKEDADEKLKEENSESSR